MELENVEKEATEEIEACSDLDQLNETRVKYLGKKGLIQGFMSRMRDLSNEERPKFGALVNKIKSAVEERIKAYYKAQDLSLEKMNVEMEQTISNFSNIINLSFKAIFIVLGVANELGVVPTSFIGVSLLGVLIGIFGIGGALLIGVIFFISAGAIPLSHKHQRYLLFINSWAPTNFLKYFSAKGYFFIISNLSSSE